MPATPINVAQARRAVKYDGTNSADIAALISDFTVTSETATELNFTSGGQALSVPTNGWLVYHQGAVAPEDVFANADDFEDQYTDLSEASEHVHEIVLTSGPAKAPGAAVDE